MAMQNDYFQLPFVFNLRHLEKDLNICLRENWPLHFNTSNYSGNWKAISLRSNSGNSIEIFAHADSSYTDTPLLKECVYFKEILQQLNCKKEAVRLLKLDPGSEIKEHRDYKLGYEDGVFRIHIPIKTNSLVDFRVNHQKVTMHPGTCWYANFNLPHRVKNSGKTPRIHLVIDCIRNNWSDKLFEKAGYNFQLENALLKQTQPKQADIPQIIAELKQINTPTSEALIKNLESRMNP